MAGLLTQKPTEQLRDYIQNLFIYTTQFCFTSGAFVIEDNDENLLNLLNSNKNSKIGSKRRVTHNKYMTDKSYQYEIHLPESSWITVNCGQGESKEMKASRVFRNIKWYQFIQSRQKYIYLKPEDFGTFSIPHVKNAIDRYVLHTYKEGNRKTRREDCEKDKVKCRFDQVQTRPFEMFGRTVILDAEGNPIEEISNIETYTRKGDEVFITEPVSVFMLNLQNQPFRPHPDTDRINGTVVYLQDRPFMEMEVPPTVGAPTVVAPADVAPTVDAPADVAPTVGTHIRFSNNSSRSRSKSKSKSKSQSGGRRVTKRRSNRKKRSTRRSRN